MMNNDNLKQVIFCTETDSLQIDDSYVKRLLEVYFDLKTSLKITFIHMKGKTKYNDNGVINQIEKKKKIYIQNNKLGKNYVVNVVDTDDYFIKFEDQQRFNDIQNFCDKNGYFLVWFCRTIEEVLIEKKVEDNKKLKFAMQFVRNANKETINEASLKSDKIIRNKSNFLNVLQNIIIQ